MCLFTRLLSSEDVFTEIMFLHDCRGMAACHLWISCHVYGVKFYSNDFLCWSGSSMYSL